MGPSTKKNMCVYVRACVLSLGLGGGVGLHVPLIFRSASLLIKAAITT